MKLVNLILQSHIFMIMQAIFEFEFEFKFEFEFEFEIKLYFFLFFLVIY